ncbi:high affinity immunoglobulin epsilon receptor subunit alpha [Octodon degus]|uniref:high affinity immunoglobulin epsilon receptor subunit alpha n=1 Tax=Octodon degus TaxID=10160 RepID=UPI0003337AE9|nr:high affinity immunoglobulin epsilon receptor subunit alpha [Octodon degus]
MAAAVDGSALLWLALLFFSPDEMLTAPQKTVITLSPPWNRIFEGESVTLTCSKNNHTSDSSTKWFHNDTNSATTTSKYTIVNATLQDSGKYECQYQNLRRSQPVHLEVCKNWLLLQTSAEMVPEGESLSLRCHGWKNVTIYKPIYYKDGQAFKYCYENSVSITIATMGLPNSGTYHCSGFFSPKHWEEDYRYYSEPLMITVQKAHPSKYIWLQLTIPLLVMILLLVDTWLYVSTGEQFKSFLKRKPLRKATNCETHIL